jgi:hypothetical protein
MVGISHKAQACSELVTGPRVGHGLLRSAISQGSHAPAGAGQGCLLGNRSSIPPSRFRLLVAGSLRMQIQLMDKG